MSNDQKSLYKDALMHHFKHPYNKRMGAFDDSFISARGSNPRCGDDIEIGIAFTSFKVSANVDISSAEFRGRGCSVCLASASMMVKAIEGMSANRAYALSQAVKDWIESNDDIEQDIPEILQALSAVKNHPARKKCVMLAWNAFQDIYLEATAQHQ